MKNFSHKNKCNTVTEQVHVDPSPIPLIKSKNDDKLDKNILIKFRKDPTS